MATNRSDRALSKAQRGPGAGVTPAAVAGLDDKDPTRVLVRASPGGGPAGLMSARLALASPYRPAEGDRVLVAGSGEDLYVIGVLHAAGLQALALPDGGRVEIREGAAELRDPAGRLLVRYANGAAEIAAPTGDLTLSAPEGRVVVRSGTDIELDAGRDLTQRAAHRAEVEAPHLEIKAGAARVATGQATVIAERILTTASVIAQSVERFELTATRVIEKTRDAYREATDLCQTRAGRVRAVVEDVYALYSRRTTMASKDDTSIDGKRVLLG